MRFCAYCGGSLEDAEKLGPVCSRECATKLRGVCKEAAHRVENGGMLRGRSRPRYHGLCDLAWQEVARPALRQGNSILSIGEKRATDAITVILAKNWRASTPKGQLTIDWCTELAPELAASGGSAAAAVSSIRAWHLRGIQRNRQRQAVRD